MKRLGVIQIQKEHWHGSQVLCVDAMPASINPDLIVRLTAMCSTAGISPELCLLSDCESLSNVKPLLILRTGNPTMHGLCSRLDEMAERIGGMLAAAGFRIHPVNAVENENRRGLREYESLARRLNEPLDGILCFPEEEVTQKYYVPASWTSMRPVNLEEWVDLLSRHRGGMLSLALDCTAMKLPELRMIDKNCGWLSIQGADDETRQALDRYRTMLGWHGKPLFRMTLQLRGDSMLLREFSAMARKEGLGAVIMPAVYRGEADYLTVGDIVVNQYADAFAHRGLSSDEIAPELRRLSHLIEAEEPPKRVKIATNLRIPGVPINRLPVDSEPLPSVMIRAGGICLGEHATTGVSVTVPPIMFTRHAVLAGTPGSGKTVFAAELLSQLWKRDIPFLVIETSGGAYRGLTKMIPELRVYTPGRSGVSPMRINPFLPPRGVTLEMYLPGLTKALAAGLNLGSSDAQALSDALHSCYIRHGWRNDSTSQSTGVRVFGMYDFLLDMRAHLTEQQFACAAGIAELLDENPLLYDADQSTPDLFTTPTLIELSALDPSSQRPLLLMLLLNLAMHHARTGGVRGLGLKNVILVDEAHEAFGGANTPAAKLFQDLSATASMFGTGLILCDLAPERLSSSIISGAKLKIMMRMSMSPDSAFSSVSSALSQLPAGEAFVYTDELGRPVHVKLRDGRRLSRYVSDADVTNLMDKPLPPPFGDCGSCGSCTLSVRLEGDFIARSICQEHLSKMENRQQAMKFLKEELSGVMEGLMKQRGVRKDKDRIVACARAHLKRHIMLMDSLDSDGNP